MFIRKREYKDKRGRTNGSYQVIESYREGGKVKQRTICNLFYLSTPAAALERVSCWLENCSDPQKAAELRARITKLKSVVAKMSTMVDVSATTTGKRSGKKPNRLAPADTTTGKRSGRKVTHATRF